MRQDWDSGLSDPYILEIASKFLEGFEREMNQQHRLIDLLDSDDATREALAPHLSQYYEGKTREELLERAPIISIAVGVAYALRHLIPR
jgi:hypothetical protein